MMHRYDVQGHRYKWLHNERLNGSEHWSQWEHNTIHIMDCQASGRVRQCLKEDDCIVGIH